MGTKPAIQSVTLWANLVMAALAFFMPPELLNDEMKVLVVAGVNAAIRYFITEKPLSGLF